MSQAYTSQIKINGSLDRSVERDHITPTMTNEQCPHFHQRFIGWGKRMERRAVCGADIRDSVKCDYQHITTDGTKLCLRYWYGPKFEIVDELPKIPCIQKLDEYGNLLFYDANDIEVSTPTERKVMIPITEAKMIPYLEANIDQETGEYTVPHFFSAQWEDTHGKQFKLKDGTIGWFSDI